MVDARRASRSTFLDVHVPAHLAFYRAGIAAVTDEDAYAGLLVSMHGAGIYRQRYGAGPRACPHARAGGAGARRRLRRRAGSGAIPARMDEVGVDDELRLADYHRLQWFDRFSLAFCLRDWDEPGEPFEVGSFRFEPVGPWRSAGRRRGRSPSASLECSLVRRLVPKRAWRQAEFREAFFELPAERVDDRARRAMTDDERLTWLRVPTEDELPPEVLELWQPSLEKLGFVPNVLRLYALRPDTCSPGTPGTTRR